VAFAPGTTVKLLGHPRSRALIGFRFRLESKK
jgi:hypothetical protein